MSHATAAPTDKTIETDATEHCVNDDVTACTTLGNLAFQKTYGTH